MTEPPPSASTQNQDQQRDLPLPQPGARDPAMDYITSKPYRPSTQRIIIDNVNIKNKCFTVSTDISVFLLDPTLTEIRLNLGQYCLLPSEDSTFEGKVTIDGSPVEYERTNMTISGFPDDQPKSLDNFQNFVEVIEAKRRNEYKLVLKIPSSMEIHQGQRILVHIDTKVVNPKKGVHYVLNYTPEGELDQSSHFYTYKASFESSTHEWLPCFDTFNMLAVFDIIIRLPDSLAAVASGEHTATNEKDDGTVEYVFRQLVPTSAVNIGFAVGVFQQFIHPEMQDVMFLCPIGFLPMLKHTVAHCGRVFEFFEELLSSRFPFACFHVIFVYNLPDDFIAYTSFSILSVDLLYHKKIIDVVQTTRKQIVNAIASQFFGCFVQPYRYRELWLVRSLARFITFLYIERSFGQCEYTYEFYTAMKEGELVLRILHNKLGKESFMKVLHRLIYVATHFGQLQRQQMHWYYLTLTVETFFQTVLNVTGREVHYQVNRKRNIIEVEVKQEAKKGRQIYTGPLTVSVQEIDGSYNHIIQIDKDYIKEDIQCHSKGRNKKKKKVLISVGEEVEIDFSRFDPEATVLWVRIDPEMLLIREVNLSQPLIHHEYTVLYERDVCAQLNAINVFKQTSTIQTIDVLNQVLANERLFYQVRVAALKALSHARTRFAGSTVNSKGLIEIFQDFYGSKSAPHIIASNNIVILPRSLQKYAIMQHFARSLAIVRDQRGQCPIENVKFIASLLFYNDNSTNRFSDDFLRSSYIEALGRSLTQTEKHSADLKNVDEATLTVIEETTRTLNLEMMKPSFGRIILISCLNVICDLQKFGHIPVDLEFFWLYTDPSSSYLHVRVAAILCIVKLIRANNRSKWFEDAMPRVIEFIVNDSEPRFIYLSLAKIAEIAPFHFMGESAIKAKNYPINCQKLFDILWTKMNDEHLDDRIRLLLIDLFYVFYGRDTPELYSEPLPSFNNSRNEIS
uniref:Transcription initiation factor TFIID subunit 2 n=1 Tax=Panagrolaimus sp. PS1159 TaxID=55785 RepID=A0AC35GHD0_9BILA